MILLVSLTVAFAFAAAADPTVQLSHGGQLQGKHILYNDVEVAVFLGEIFNFLVSLDRLMWV